MDTRKLETFWQPGGDKPHGRVQTLNFRTERIATMEEQPGQKAQEYAKEIVERFNAYPEAMELLLWMVNAARIPGPSGTVTYVIGEDVIERAKELTNGLNLLTILRSKDGK